jgi:penicillin-binding protein 1B
VKKHRIRRTIWLGLLAAFPCFLIFAAILAFRFYSQLEQEVVERFSSHHWAIPSKIYSESTLLYQGIDLHEIGLFDRLTYLDYRPVEGAVRTRGEYFYDPRKEELQLFFRAFPYPSREKKPQRVKLSLQGGRIERLMDLDEQTELPIVEVEPEVIAGLYDETWEERRVVKLYDVPSLLVKAILAAEDQRFFEHEGIDFWRILGAGWANLLAGGAVQGGSTLTQQLIKNFFLSREKTFVRKMVEVCMAVIIENHYSKLEILENYLNEIYLGQRGARGIFGVWEAAHFYFGKEPRDLTLGEMATLAGIVRAPNWYAPNRHPQRATQRRNYVLQRMLELNDIAQQEYQAAVQEPVGVRISPIGVGSAPYFADLIRKELQEHYSGEMLATAGLQIHTSLDMHLQRIAEETVQNGLEGLEKKYPRLRRDKPEERLQASLIAIQPQTGAIRAMVGGRDYQISQFNRATQARRQPGSIFKPIVYLAALARERERREGRFLPTSFFDDSPFTWFYGDKQWSPGNYKDEYLGRVTLRQALEMSLNAATARIAQQVGLEPIRQTAQQLGIVSPLPPYPSLVLGAAEVAPFEVAVAFSTLANQGVRVVPVTVKRVVNQEGETLDRRTIRAEQVIPPEDAYLLTHLLEGVMERGTGRSARQNGFERAAAGKTGTTNDFGDAWFVGYTPDLLAVVWVGFDHRESLGLSGGQAALPIWTEFMKRATAGQPAAQFMPPPGVTLVKIDRTTGCRATPESRRILEEAFYSGEEPDEFCQRQWYRRYPIADTPPPPLPLPRDMDRPPLREEPWDQFPTPTSPRPGEKRPWWRLF